MKAAHTGFLQDIKHLVYIVAAASAIGQGARMLFQATFVPGTSYIPKGVDLWFDWGILLTFGVYILADQLVKVGKGAPA